MPRPTPSSVRLIDRAAKGRPPRAPFGLPAWSDQGEAVVVQLDGHEGGSLGADAVALQLPDRAEFAEPTLLVVLGAAARAAPPWWRLGFAGSVEVPREARCSALVMRGYVEIGAAVDPASSADIAWGWSSRRS